MIINKIFFIILLIKLILSEDTDDSFLLKVYGDSYVLNYYYITLYLGEQKSPQQYILDTGSETTTSTCDKCTSCGQHKNKPYKIANEKNIIKCNNSSNCLFLPHSVCINKQCCFLNSYQEESLIFGFYNFQKVYFEKINKFGNITLESYIIPMGCTTKETGNFIKEQDADGIMGLNNNENSFISLLYKNKIISKNLFSLCFSNYGGYFSVGGINRTFHKSKINYIPLTKIERQVINESYLIELTQIKIGKKKIFKKNEHYKAFIDSGKTLSYFPEEIYNSMVEAFKSMCDKKNEKCGRFENITDLGYCGIYDSFGEKEKIINNYWPDMTYYFGDKKYNLSPNDYYFYYFNPDSGLKLACLGIDIEQTDIITLGTTFMHGHDIIFDKEKQRIGFALADCNINIKGLKEENGNIENNDNIEKKKYDKSEDL